MSITDYLPIVGKSQTSTELEETYSPQMSVKARAIEPRGASKSIFGNFLKRNRALVYEESPFDFKKIASAIDTDSYIKQAFAKYEDLFWKEGWDITGQNEKAIDYVWSKISSMEKMMGIPFQLFLTEVANELLRYSNVFIAKARDDRGRIQGYYIIPTETVRVKRDRYNRPLSYAQELEGNTKGKPTKTGQITWPASDVIHLFLYRRPGRAFGTPFIEAVLEDVESLRQLEEDILNLTHRELFPLYLYLVGTKDLPPAEGELDLALGAIEDLKSEGGLVAPGNHDIKVLGAEGNSLEVTAYLAHFKERVAIGLGVSPHHLGMMESTSNRSVTERLDLALYDKVKNLQTFFEDAMRIHFLGPLLEEAGFDPAATNLNVKDGDTCFFQFKEIDIQTQISRENHYIDLFLKNAITFSEMRERLALPPGIENPDEIFMVMQAKINAYVTQTSQPPAQGDDGSKNTSQPGKVNMPNLSKSTTNKDQPANQHGRRRAPKINQNYDTSFVERFQEFIKDDEES